MSGQIKWWVQNGPITKNEVFPVTTSFFTKFCFSLRTLLWCSNDPNDHIPIFCKRWSFIWRCFFPMSILKWLILKLWNDFVSEEGRTRIFYTFARNIIRALKFDIFYTVYASVDIITKISIIDTWQGSK